MKTVKKPKTEDQGIQGLLKFQKAKKDGEKLFHLILKEKIVPEAIHSLVYQESLRELIFFTIDHRKEVTVSINRFKSIEKRAKKKERDRELVFAWCNNNPDLAWLPLRKINSRASADTKIQQHTSIRDNISLWRKEHKKK
jgi:hypothetical protein